MGGAGSGLTPAPGLLAHLALPEESRNKATKNKRERSVPQLYWQSVHQCSQFSPLACNSLVQQLSSLVARMMLSSSPQVHELLLFCVLAMVLNCTWSPCTNLFLNMLCICSAKISRGVVLTDRATVTSINGALL